MLPQMLTLTCTAHNMAPFARDMGTVNDKVNNAGYMLDRFPIVREQDIKAFGRFRTRGDIKVLALLH